MNDHDIFSQALIFATQKHMGQTRRDGITPYISHPIAVAEIVKRAGGDTRTQVVALLHDTLEDTDATEEEILEFGPDILEAVKLLTRPDGANEKEYVDKILANRMAAIVKNADKIHNMSQAPFCDNKKWAKRYTDKSRKYYYGKFSHAVDQMIDDADDILCGYKSENSLDTFTQKDFLLFIQLDEIRYQKGKEEYQKNTTHPDFINSELRYWFDEELRTYFCYIGHNGWRLGKAGWIPLDYSSGRKVHSDDMFPISKEKMMECIEKRINRNCFYDFVDLTNLF